MLALGRAGRQQTKDQSQLRARARAAIPLMAFLLAPNWAQLINDNSAERRIAFDRRRWRRWRCSRRCRWVSSKAHRLPFKC